MIRYTCEDAAKFDPALRRFEAANMLFHEAQVVLPPSAVFHQVEFDTECTNEGAHGERCRINSVTIKHAPDGHDGPIFSLPFSRLSTETRDAVAVAHYLAHGA